MLAPAATTVSDKPKPLRLRPKPFCFERALSDFMDLMSSLKRASNDLIISGMLLKLLDL
ncbi:Hypothetical protein PMT_2330 [Prochlorococcus marinus str. MIT 9313]|uniref:Uncharacterized protein n=1 Tax=Prochlorococcus marinus (strain MIT 9313) TaxID=74547 RepID=B9ERH4_PROMM|nr:Hypothetical protein PMT_2330 [Prochlorococcus marinus str. MIT 9313]